jgi:hypothetical protein
MSRFETEAKKINLTASLIKQIATSDPNCHRMQK